MKQYVDARIKALQAELVARGLDAAMIYDRENLIFFAGVDDLEGGALAIPAKGEPSLFCLWMDKDHMQETSGIKNVVPFYFPQFNQSKVMGKWLEEQGWKAPRLGFTRYFISLNDYLFLKKAAPDMVVEDIALLCYKLRSVKDAEEIQRMEIAAKALTAGMQAAFDAAAPGVKETDVLAEAEYAMRKAGSQGSPFRMQVLTHNRQMLMHPYASDATLTPNAPVVIHLGASYLGYGAKMCRTVFLGKPNPQAVDIYKTLIHALEVAVAGVRPGMTTGELYDMVTAVVMGAGYESKYWIMEHIGYGVGIRQSEFYPIIDKGGTTVLEENMIIDLLLPTIYIPGVGGPRVTDTILIGKNGGRRLTDFPTEIVYK